LFEIAKSLEEYGRFLLLIIILHSWIYWFTACKSSCLGELLLKLALDQFDYYLLIDYREILVTGVKTLLFLYLNDMSIIC
jgi:hypothetical protein